jgi:hypothetical protein
MKVRRATWAGCWRATRASTWRCSGSVGVQNLAAREAYRGPDGLRDHGVDVSGGELSIGSYYRVKVGLLENRSLNRDRKRRSAD